MFPEWNLCRVTGEALRELAGNGDLSKGNPRLGGLPGTISSMKCDLCSDDDGKGIHYHAFIDGKHYWVCASCKKKHNIESEHTDE